MSLFGLDFPFQAKYRLSYLVIDSSWEEIPADSKIHHADIIFFLVRPLVTLAHESLKHKKDILLIDWPVLCLHMTDNLAKRQF